MVASNPFFLAFLLLFARFINGYDLSCRTVARLLPSNGTVPGNLSSTARNFDDVDILWSDADDFLITKRLGSGSYGEAYLGHNVTSLQQFVIKTYRFGKLKMKKMKREILVTQFLCGHDNIIKLFHVIRQGLTGYPALVFEYAPEHFYRNLYPTLTPSDVRHYMYEIFLGLEYAHGKGVIHKDLKPGNIMIDHDTRRLKLIDWGLSNFYVQREIQSIAGSLYYKSPEMLLYYGMSDYSSDIWSLGAIFAGWLFRRDIMFQGGSVQEQLKAIANVLGTEQLLAYNYKYGMNFNTTTIVRQVERVPWERFITPESLSFATPEALDLLSHMLVYDHKLRISAKDALKHPYFRPERLARANGSVSTIPAIKKPTTVAVGSPPLPAHVGPKVAFPSGASGPQPVRGPNPPAKPPNNLNLRGNKP